MMFKKEDIKALTPEEAETYIIMWSADPSSVERGLFLAPEDNCWTAIDNSSGDCNVEDFKTLNAALLWLEDGYISAEEAKRIVKTRNSFMSSWSDNML